MSSNTGAPARDRRPHSEFDHGDADETAWSDVLSLWRTRPARAFGAARRSAVESCVLQVSSTLEVWRLAVDGDVAAAVHLGLDHWEASEITLRVDLALTILLRCAFTDATAALVLSHLIRRMPLAHRSRETLAASWLARHVQMLRDRQGSRCTAIRRREDGEGVS